MIHSFCDTELTCIFPDEKQSNTAEEPNQPEAEPRGSPEEQSMETNAGDDSAADQGKKEREKLKEAKVCPIFTNPTFIQILNPFTFMLIMRRK